MKYRALVSFTGTISMATGGVREISDSALANNLIKCGYVEEVKEKAAEKKETVTETAAEKVTEKKKSPKRKEKKDGN